MIKLQDVSYVRLGTADLDGATKFATEFLGLEVAYRSKESVYLKSDQREHTLCYFTGSPADQAAAPGNLQSQPRKTSASRPPRSCGRSRCPRRAGSF